MEQNTDSVSQAKRSKDGMAFQKEIFCVISTSLKDHSNIKVISPRARVYKLSLSKKLPTFSCMQVHTNIGSFIGDTDIVIYNSIKREPVILVSCKTSLREQYEQSLFNFILYRRKYPNIVSFLVTKDPEGELGTEIKPRKARVLLTSENVFVFSTNENGYGGCINPFEKLVPQIKFIAGVN